MSEIIDNAEARRNMLKHMIMELHRGTAPDVIRGRIAQLLKSIPYNEVVQVEQELIAEGLPALEVQKLCDIHHKVLDGTIDQGDAKSVPPGHPVDVFRRENERLKEECDAVSARLDNLPAAGDTADARHALLAGLNRLMDVDKHYRRKENLLFPFLEKNGITGPPKVMWGKHDEARDLLKGAIAALREVTDAGELGAVCELAVKPAVEAVAGMILKEDQILLPMSMDVLSEVDWLAIHRQTGEIGYCLYDPPVDWHPDGTATTVETAAVPEGIRLHSGAFTVAELEAMLNTLPIDITFVDASDRVKYFSQGKERIFDRNRAILGRDVRLCHPPASVHVVEQIIADFRSGRQDVAPFWIQMGERLIHIAYYAVRDRDGNYLGTVEMSHDIAPLRALEGEQRILSYEKK